MADSDDSGVVGGGGSRAGSDSETTYSGGGSDTTTGSGVTGDDGDDTSYGGGGDTSTSAPTGSTGSDDPSGGGSDDDDDDSGVVGGGGSRAGSDSDTTYTGGGSDTDAGSGVTGDDGDDTTYSGGGSSTQTGSGVTGDDSGGAATEPDDNRIPGDADSDRLDDADRGISSTRPGTPGGGGQLERSERARQDAREDDRLPGGLEMEYGGITGEEGETADRVQQLQGRIDRETPVDAFHGRDQYDIVRTGDGALGVEFADSVGVTRSRREQRQQIAEDVAAEREDVDTEDVTVTSTASGFSAVVTQGAGVQGVDAVITGGPEREPVATEIQEGETADRGTGVTRNAQGGSVVVPERGTPADATDAAPWSQAQRDASVAGAGAQQRASMRAAMTRMGSPGQPGGGAAGGAGGQAGEEPPLIEPDEDYSAVELVTGQAGGPRLQQAAINDALGAVGLDDELGFREPTGEQTGLDPQGADPLSYLRGAGPRRQFSVESETVGGAVREEVTGDDVLGAAAVGVAAPEPSTTVAGAAVLGTAGVLAAGDRLGGGGPAQTITATQQSELDVPDDRPGGELDVPEQQRQGELSVPEETGREEIDVPQDRDAFSSELEPGGEQSSTELPVPSGGESGGTVEIDEGSDSVVPGDFPLAGRDMPADPAREYVPGEQIDAPVVGASPVGVTQPEVEEEEGEDDDLGVPTDDPFRVSDRRLYDPQREFGEQEDVANVPDEATPEEIDDVGSGIAGQGQAMEPARGETVAENWEQYLQEQDAERRREQAWQQEALVEDDSPTSRGRVRERVESASRERAQQRTRAVEDSLLGIDGPLNGLLGGGLAREDQGAGIDSRGRLDTRDQLDTRADQRPETQPQYDASLTNDVGQEVQTDVIEQTQQVPETVPEVIQEMGMGTPAVPENVPENVPEYPTPPETAPPRTPPGTPPRIPLPDLDEEDFPEEDDRRTQISDEVFDTGVVQSLDELERGGGGFF